MSTGCVMTQPSMHTEFASTEDLGTLAGCRRVLCLYLWRSRVMDYKDTGVAVTEDAYRKAAHIIDGQARADHPLDLLCL